MLIGVGTALLAPIASPAPISPGWWQTRTLVQGSAAAPLALVCIEESADWISAILPPALLDGCARAAAGWPIDVGCARGGRLAVTGTVKGERFDIVARRTGPIAAHPDAVAVLHVEGVRAATACPSRAANSRALDR